MSAQLNIWTELESCSFLGCSKRGIVIIGILDAHEQWRACSSEHARQLMREIQDKRPGHRGFWTRGVKR
jgi:hypothetical protein